jgi:microcystin-dependent protein
MAGSIPEPFLGQIALFPYTFAPGGWMDCAGQVLAIGQYGSLFALLGTTYGGNGTTNFALPDLQGRAPLGFGAGPGLQPYNLGAAGGQEGVVLTEATTAAHTHPLQASRAAGTANTTNDAMLALGQKGLSDPSFANIYNPAPPNQTMMESTIEPWGMSTPQAHDNMQPSLVLRYCIAVSGVFPNRSQGA